VWIEWGGVRHITVAAGQCHPVWVQEIHWGEGEHDYGYFVDEREDTLLRWMGEKVQGDQWDSGKMEMAAEQDEWWFEGIEQMMGWDNESETRMRWQRYLGPLSEKEMQDSTLLVYSDGSYKAGGGQSRGSDGFQIWGFEGRGELGVANGERTTGGCVVHGDPLLLNSTRCEHAGGLAALIATHWVGWQGRVKVTMDNSGVTDRMSEKSTQGVRWRDETIAEQPMDWLKLRDPDIHAEAVAWCSRFESVEWLWHPGHPEDRKHESQFDQHA